MKVPLKLYFPLAAAALLCLNVHCSSSSLSTLLPPEPAGMRVPAASTKGSNWLVVRSLRCDRENNRVFVNMAGGPGFEVQQEIRHDGKKLTSVANTFSRTPNDDYDRALAISSTPIWASWPGGSSLPSAFATPKIASGPKLSSMPGASSSQYIFDGVIRANVVFLDGSQVFSSYPHNSSSVSVVSFPKFKSLPLTINGLRYASYMVTSAPVPAWRNWPVEKTRFEVFLTRLGISRAVLTQGRKVRSFSERKNETLSDPELALFTLRTAQLGEVTKSALSCCVGKLEAEASCIRQIEGVAASSDGKPASPPPTNR